MTLKSFILAAMMAFFACTANAQTAEPEFIGEVFHLDPAGQTTLLEKQRVVVKTKAGASMYIVGIGKIKSKINIKGGKSNTRFPASEKLQLIVKAVDNESDPMSIVAIFKFKANSKSRKAELSSLSTFGGQSDNNMDFVDFTAKKYGESSYLIEINHLEPGEYGITVTNPNNKDEKNLIVSCFGID